MGSGHGAGPGLWGWCYPCRSVPRNSACLRAGTRISRKRNPQAIRYYTATVVSCRVLTNGRSMYVLNYADGDRETNVPGATVRTQAATPTLAVCARVQGNYRGRGRWYPGRITRASNGRYMVQYDDGDKETLT